MLKKTTLAGLAMLALAATTQAVALPISGEIDVRGRFSTNTGNLNDATALSIDIAYAVGGTDDYAYVPDGTLVDYQSFTFLPSLVGPVNPLWTFTVGGVTYSFVLNDLQVLTQSATALSLFGTGMLSITGFDATQGTWEFNGYEQDGRFKFMSESANVPEPGTLALLGLGLLGVGFARRRKTH